MGATSVTGVGVGASHAGVKGPGNGRNFYVPQLTPHIVIADTVTLSSGALTVTFPNELSGSETGYVIFATAESSNAVGVSAKTDTTGNFSSFDLTGTSTDEVMYMVAKKGFGLDA